MKKYWPAHIFLLLLMPLTAAYAAQGKIQGEESYTLPGWFKESFLEIQDEISDARDNNRHIMLFMHIDRCPYCTRLLEENFRTGENQAFMQKNFDVIALNIRGDREIIWDKDTRYSEKTLARELKVHFTPTLVFLDTDGKKVFQMNGYRKPDAFRQVLDYVHEKKYQQMKLVDYISQVKEPVYNFRAHPQFIEITNFSSIKEPLAIIFEDRGCVGCDEFHLEVLQHEDVLEELKKFRVVRLDALSTQSIIDTKGNKTTPKEWAKALKLDYRPGTVLFDGGDEITRADGHLYHFHYKELLRYVSGSFYFEYPTYLAYLGPRQKQLLDSGINIDFGK